MRLCCATACIVFTVVMSAQSFAQQKPSRLPTITPSSSETRIPRDGAEFFETKIRPMLVKHCYQCHSGDQKKAKGHFVVDTRVGFRKGGNSGEVISPKHPEDSLLIEALKYEGLEMPPSGQLPEEVIEDFEKWIEMGAPDPRSGKAANVKNKIDLAAARKYWAFQKPKKHEPPIVEDDKWPMSNIDRFVLAKLEKASLKPVHDADPVTLIRRVSFDLTGLPPSPDEIDAFLKDTSLDGYTQVVDRLLDSPRFGERWGRHWLDVVRYAESSGKERNIPYRYAWKYRDYVIDSFNADLPYDQFITQQLAGDTIQARNPDERNRHLIATGFLAIGPKSINTRNKEQFDIDVIDDQIDVTGRAFLGMTIACARCHDHKFDPIPTTDYYAIAGIFKSTETMAGIVPGRKTGTETQLIKLSTDRKPVRQSDDRSDDERKRDQEIADIEKELDQLQSMQMAAKQMNSLSQKSNVKAKRKKNAGKPKIDRKAVGDKIKKLEDRLDELESKTPVSEHLAMGVHDSSNPSDIAVLVRGELKEKGPIVPRGVLTVLKQSDTPKVVPKQSGRLALARWIADRDNPLTARVMVNRIWQHLFGQGLVDTVDNFGALGNDPTHPELLDVLAIQFMENKWSIKKQIRSIVLSRTYRLSSEHNDHNYEKDPDSKLCWRMPRRRLDAEEIRDAMLVASGQIDFDRPDGSAVTELSNRGVGGGKGMQQIRKSTNVRSVYLPILRGVVPEMLSTFDMADPNLIVGKRDTTTVATQALYLMNNPFVLKHAEEFAKRVINTKGVDETGHIDLAYRIALGRTATAEEHQDVSEYLQDFKKAYTAEKPKGNAQLAAWTSFCQTLFESAMFRYAY